MKADGVGQSAPQDGPVLPVLGKISGPYECAHVLSLSKRGVNTQVLLRFLGWRSNAARISDTSRKGHLAPAESGNVHIDTLAGRLRQRKQKPGSR